MENSDEHEPKHTLSSVAEYKCTGKAVGIISAIFNAIGIVFFIAYGASMLSILFNVIFWMFGEFYFIASYVNRLENLHIKLLK